MSRRAILALSAAVSAFVLVLVGAVAGYAVPREPVPVAQTGESVPVDVVRAREAEYRRLVDEANARLALEQAAKAGEASQTLATPATIEPSHHHDDDDEVDEDHDDDRHHHDHHEHDDHDEHDDG